MAALVTHEEVARRIGISDDTMRKYYREELDTAKTKVDVKVWKTLILAATGGPEGDWTKANITAAIVYAKTRMGWSTRRNMSTAAKSALRSKTT